MEKSSRAQGDWMMENILRFPGFIVSPDRKKVFKDGKVYRSTVAMAKDLP